MAEIARHFIRKGHKKRSGEIDWDSTNIRSMLTNERYCGDVLSRKTCTLDFRTHKTIVNKGHKPQYYIEDHHDGIISKKDFQKVQEIIKLDNKNETPKSSYKKTPFSSRIICSSCGKNYHRFGNKTKVVRWRCSSNNKSNLLCDAKSIEEGKIEELLIEGFEKRYDIGKRTNDGLLIKQLIKELSNAEAVREREQNLLRVELERCLIAENKAILKNLDTEEVKSKRLDIEDKISNKTKLWENLIRIMPLERLL